MNDGLFLPHFLSFSRIENFSHQFRDYKKGLVPSAQPPDPHHPNRSPAEISQGSGDHVGIQWYTALAPTHYCDSLSGNINMNMSFNAKNNGLKTARFPKKQFREYSEV